MRGRSMADIFVSYTASDRGWAFWIGRQLDKLGHKPHIHEWEIQGGGDIAAGMEECQDKADHTLCVISEAYLKQPYSNWERRAAEWAANSGRPNFVLPVFVQDCKPPTFFASYKRCDLWGVTEVEARARLTALLSPRTNPQSDAEFPDSDPSVKRASARPASIAFPGAK